MTANPLCRPDFIFGGAPRTATTSIYHYFSKHPSVHVSPIKEPCFLALPLEGERDSQLGVGGETVEDAVTYLKLFTKPDESIKSGEFSTIYLASAETVIDNCFRHFGNQAVEIKWIFILRDPFRRAYSNYELHKRLGLENESFDMACARGVSRTRLIIGTNITFDYLRCSQYAENITKFRSAFPHVKVILFEDILKDKRKSIGEIEDFLNIPQTKKMAPLENLNSSKEAKNAYVRILKYIAFARFPGRRLVKKVLGPKWAWIARAKINSFGVKDDTSDIDLPVWLQREFQREREACEYLLKRSLSDAWKY